MKSFKSTKPPVVLFVYNRPAQTRLVLKSLKNNNIPLLYIFSDGPRKGDEKKVTEVRQVLREIDWVKPYINQSTSNLGLSESIKLGLTEVFKKHKSAVVVEDDIEVAPNFYDYMAAGLANYTHSQHVAGITGLKYPFQQPSDDNYKYDTFLFPRFSSWGWGTWRHVWEALNWNRNELIEGLRTSSAPLEIGGRDLRDTFKLYMSGELSGSWDVDFLSNMILNDQVFVWPTWNMVNNLGLLEGTHASGEAPQWRLVYEKRKMNGSYKFFKDPYISIPIYQSFLSFFEGVKTGDQTNGNIRRNKMTAKHLARRSLGKAKRFVVKPNRGVGGNQKPSPSEYSTVTEPLEVPVQKEAYFIALNNYIQSGDKVLDVGCGLGYGLNLLAIKAGEVTGIDIDDKAIQYSEASLRGKNPKLKGLDIFDGYKLPYKNNSFDVITCVDVLEHVEKYNEFVEELLRVAKRAVLISTPNRRAEYTNPDGTPKNYWHLREWSRGELNAILSKHGAKVEWHHVNGPWEGPFTVSRVVKSNTMTLTPVLVKK